MTAVQSEPRTHARTVLWDAAQIQRLTHLWEVEKLSGSQIAARFGVSKNVIMGKAHRLKLTARPSPIKQGGRRKRGKRVGEPVSLVTGPVIVDLPLSRVASCQWPMNDDKPYTFCGCTRLVPGKSYCLPHAAVAFIPLECAQ